MSEMTEKNELPEQASPEQEQTLPGRRLREAREAKGFSREEVAAQLRLQVRLITALEEDDYEGLPAQTFVSGYLRSYARLLELPEESVVAPAVAKSEPPPPLVSKAASRKQASSRDALTRLVTYLIVAAIAVSVAMWWLAQRQAVEPVPSAPEPEIADQGGSLALTLPEAAAPAVSGDIDMPEPTEAGEAEQPAAETETEAKFEAPASEQPQPAEAVVEESSAEAQSAPPPLTEEIPQSKLELNFQADCWTEISDSAGRQLAYGLIKAGEVLVLRGEAPFRVFLGYAPGVTVYYNNDLFDHSPFQRRDVARFRIGRAEHNHPGSR